MNLTNWTITTDNNKLVLTGMNQNANKWVRENIKSVQSYNGTVIAKTNLGEYSLEPEDEEILNYMFD
jgi:hypothetical protein